jgi:hypothetical protein
MKVTIDPAIEKDPELKPRVERANRYLESQLGPFWKETEAEWALRSNGTDQITLRARFTDDPPGEASDTFDAKVLDKDYTSNLWVRGVVNALLGERASALLGRVRTMFEQLDRNEEAGGAADGGA